MTIFTDIKILTNAYRINKIMANLFSALKKNLKKKLIKFSENQNEFWNKMEQIKDKKNLNSKLKLYKVNNKSYFVSFVTSQTTMKTNYHCLNVAKNIFMSIALKFSHKNFKKILNKVYVPFKYVFLRISAI